MSRDFLVPTGDGALIKLRVSPGARRTSIEGAYGEDAVKLRGAAPSGDGKANAEAVRSVARVLGVPRSSEVAVIRGAEVGELREVLSRQHSA